MLLPMASTATAAKTRSPLTAAIVPCRQMSGSIGWMTYAQAASGTLSVPVVFEQLLEAGAETHAVYHSRMACVWPWRATPGGDASRTIVGCGRRVAPPLSRLCRASSSSELGLSQTDPAPSRPWGRGGATPLPPTPNHLRYRGRLQSAHRGAVPALVFGRALRVGAVTSLRGAPHRRAAGAQIDPGPSNGGSRRLGDPVIESLQLSAVRALCQGFEHDLESVCTMRNS